MRCPAALTHISVTAPKIGYHNFYYFSISMTSPVGVAVRLQGNGRYYCFPTNRYLGHGRTRSSSALSGHFLRVNNPLATAYTCTHIHTHTHKYKTVQMSILCFSFFPCCPSWVHITSQSASNLLLLFLCPHTHPLLFPVCPSSFGSCFAYHEQRRHKKRKKEEKASK